MDVKTTALIVQSVVIFCYIFGSAMLLPKLVKKLPFWQVAIIAALCGIFVGLIISQTGYILSH